MNRRNSYNLYQADFGPKKTRKPSLSVFLPKNSITAILKMRTNIKIIEVRRDTSEIKNLLRYLKKDKLQTQLAAHLGSPVYRNTPDVNWNAIGYYFFSLAFTIGDAMHNESVKSEEIGYFYRKQPLII